MADRQVPGNRMVATRALRNPAEASADDEMEVFSVTVSLFAELEDGRRITDEEWVTRSFSFRRQSRW